MGIKTSGTHVRLRYLAGLALMALFCGLFVWFWHKKNTDFALVNYLKVATKQLHSEANLAMQVGQSVIEPTDEHDMAGRIRDMADVSDILNARLAAMEKRWADLPGWLQAELRSGSGMEEPFAGFHAFRDAIAGLAASAPEQAAGAYAHARNSYFGSAQTAFVRLETAYQAFDTAFSVELKHAINFAAGSIAVMVIALGVFIFWPMERAINRAMAASDRERQRAEDAARRAEIAERAKSEFLANMSHEIRTPMNGVMGMAEMLARTDLDGKQKMFANIIVRSGHALVTIINDILDFSRIDSGQLELDPMPFNLVEAVEDVAALVSARAQDKDLELIVRAQPCLPDLFIGDAGRFRQIVTNLAGNAVKFTDQGHVLIDISAEILGETANILVKVEDTGIGIPEDQVERVFEKFSQVDGSSTRKHEGTGLGLTISQMLVDKMGGEIGATSREGRGSIFWFSLPLPVPDGQDADSPTPVAVQGSRILVADDNDLNRLVMMEQFGAWGCEPVAASSGDEALIMLTRSADTEFRFDLAVLDHQMPGMDGGELAAAIRKEHTVADLPIIMLTSADSTSEQGDSRHLDIQGQLVKPARLSNLRELVVAALSASRRSGNPDHDSTTEAVSELAKSAIG